MSVSDAYNFKPVNERLSTSGLLSEEQLSEVGAEGYELVINLLPHESEYAIYNEVPIIAGQGISYEYIPVDFSEPTADDFLAFERVMLASAEQKILLHCAANYRASAFYAIYAYRHLGWTEATASEFIASVWNLDEYPVWKDFVSEWLSSGK